MEQRCVGKHFWHLRPHHCVHCPHHCLANSGLSRSWKFCKHNSRTFQEAWEPWNLKPGLFVWKLLFIQREGQYEAHAWFMRTTVEALARCSALVFGGWDAVGIQSLTSLSRPLVASSGRWGWGSSTFTWAQSSSSSSLSVTETKLFTQPATGRPRPHHKAIISLFPGVHMQTWTDVFSASDEMCQSTTAASALLATWSMFSVRRQRKLLITTTTKTTV